MFDRSTPGISNLRFGLQFRSNNGCLALIIASVILLVLGIVFSLISWVPYSQAQNFKEASCTIVSKEMESQTDSGSRSSNRRRSSSSGGTTYRPFFVYRVEGTGQPPFEASGYDLNNVWTSDRASVEETLNRYEVGQTYPCWYDPADYQRVVLSKDLGGSTIFAILGGIFLVIALIIIGIGAFVLNRVLRGKAIVSSPGSHGSGPSYQPPPNYGQAVQPSSTYNPQGQPPYPPMPGAPSYPPTPGAPSYPPTPEGQPPYYPPGQGGPSQPPYPPQGPYPGSH